MRSKLINDGSEKTYVLIFDKGDEVIAELTNFATEKGIGDAHFTAIGAFEKATLGYFDRARRDYLKIPIDEQVEALSLLGDVAMKGDAPKIHAHVVGRKTRRQRARRSHFRSARLADSGIDSH